MKISLLCSFVCFSTLFLGTAFAAWDGFSSTIVIPTPAFSSCTFKKEETDFFYEKHEEKHDLLPDSFTLPGYLRWKSLGEGVDEKEQGKRSGATLRAVVDDIIKREDTGTLKMIIIFASHGSKGVAAMRFALSHKIKASNTKIVIFHPAKNARISVSPAFDEALETELDMHNGYITLLKTFDAINAFVAAMNPKDVPNTFVLEGLSEIGFDDKNGLNPDAASIMKIFFDLIDKGCRIIAIEDPVLHNRDVGLNENMKTLKFTATWTNFNESVKKEHEFCKNFKDLKDLETVFEGEKYTPFAVIFIGFLKPCYKELHKLPLVTYIYLGGHFLDPLALDKFLGIESIQKRGECKGIDKSWFPTYQKDTKLFHIVKP